MNQITNKNTKILDFQNIFSLLHFQIRVLSNRSIEYQNYNCKMFVVSQEFLQFHEHGLAIVWCLIADITLFSGFITNKKCNFYLHIMSGSIALALSYGWILPLVIPFGVYMGFGERGIEASIKTWFGIIFLGLSGILIVCGMYTKIKREFADTSSKRVILAKNIHKYVGYIILIITKASVLIGYWRTIKTVFWIVLAEQIVVLGLFCFIAFNKQRLEEFYQTEVKTIPKYIEPTDLEKSLMPFFIFKDEIYSIETLKAHPGGYEIINVVKGRELDRFLYGMYSAEMIPNIPPHSHSRESLSMVGEMLGKLKIPSPYQQLPLSFGVNITFRKQISKNIFHLQLMPVNTQLKPIFKGYSDVKELGRYFSLTINNKTTRLYTFVNFLHCKNVLFLKTTLNYKEQTNFSIKLSQKLQLKKITNTSESVEQIQSGKQMNPEIVQQLQKQEENDQQYMIPLIIKKYDTGKLTKQLLKDQFNGTIQMSSPLGLGLNFGCLKANTIFIVAGGTGIFPFLDLIDLLYKQNLISRNHYAAEQIQANNPILKNKPFSKYNFVLLATFRSYEDIHPLSLRQICHLSNFDPAFKAYLRLSSGQEIPSNIPNKIKLISKQKFTEVLEKEIKTYQRSVMIQNEVEIDEAGQLRDTSKQAIHLKVFICGPPSMNTEVAFTLKEKCQLAAKDYDFI